MEEIYDVAIIGAGPAGLNAAIYARRHGLKTLVLSNETGGEVAEAGEIENYLGYKSINGADLAKKFEDHAKKFNPDMEFEYVKKVEKDGDNFKIVGESRTYESKTVIIATGRIHRRLEIPGENEFVGHGVSYCVTCDAPFFQDKVVAVVGGGNTAVTSAKLLSKIAKKVYLIHRRDQFRADEIEVENVKQLSNVEFVLNSVVTEVKGDKVVKSIVVKNKNGEVTELSVDGVFINIGEIANSTFLDGMVNLNERGEIVVNELCETNEPGIYAAGDVTNKRDKQIITAAAQGAIAAISAYEYLSKNKRI